jgi:hypothetical protein
VFIESLPSKGYARHNINQATLIGFVFVENTDHFS